MTDCCAACGRPLSHADGIRLGQTMAVRDLLRLIDADVGGWAEWPLWVCRSGCRAPAIRRWLRGEAASARTRRVGG